MDKIAMQPVYIVLKKTAYKKSVKESYEAKTAKKIGILHIVCGIVSLSTGIVLRSIITGNRFMFGLLGTGIWSSLFFFISGCLGIVSARNSNTRIVITTLIFGVFSAVFAGLLVSISGSSLGIDNCYQSCYQNNQRYQNYIVVYNSNSYTCKWYCASGVLYTMNLLQLMAGIFELFLAIASARLSCKATCCREKFDTTSIPERMVVGPEDVDYEQISVLAMRQTQRTNMKPSTHQQRPANLYSQLQQRVQEHLEVNSTEIREGHEELGTCVKKEEQLPKYEDFVETPSAPPRHGSF